MTLAQEAADRVRGWLHDGTFERDRYYSVPQVAQMLQMSRSPVREGMLALAGAGLITFAPNRGFRAVRPSGQDLAEIFALRLAIEPGAAARAALTRVGAEAVAAALGTMRAAAADKRELEFAAADQALHTAILDAAGNRRAAALITELRDTTRLLGASTAGRSRDFATILAEHVPVVDAIADGDAAAAEKAMRSHLVQTGRLLIAQAHDDGDSQAWSAWESLIDT